MTQIGTGAAPLRLFYDSRDRSTGYEEYNSSTTGVGMYYDRDAQGRIIARYKNTITNGSWAGAGTTFYHYTAAGDTPDYLRDNSWNIIEKTLQLPGGINLTIKPTEPLTNNQKQYSAPNIHGDTLLTTNAVGTNTSNGNGPANTFTYDPFGSPLTGSVLPANTNQASYGWVGQHEKITETSFALTPVVMGARIYLPGLGRFTQVDPVEGGTENGYVYPTDPVNEFDLDGRCGAPCYWAMMMQFLQYMAKAGKIIALKGYGSVKNVLGKNKASRARAVVVPKEAYSMKSYVQRGVKSARQGYKGGERWANDGRSGSYVLPKAAGGKSVTYQSWDVYPSVKGGERGSARIVSGSDGSFYYTADHYKTFSKM